MVVDLRNLRQEGWPDAADEIERLRAALQRLHDWASTSIDWRPDAPLAREVRAALIGQ
jgi:hypothetical protein